jgi:hypothetical protein
VCIRGLGLCGREKGTSVGMDTVVGCGDCLLGGWDYVVGRRELQ